MKTYSDLKWSQLDSVGYRQAASLYEFDNADREVINNYIKKYFTIMENTDTMIIFRESDSSIVRFLSKY